MPPEEIRQLIRDSVQAELANGTFERDWSSLEFRLPPRPPMSATTPFTRWSDRARGSLRDVMRSIAQHARYLFSFVK